MKRLIKLAVLPKYRPGYGDINVVYDQGGVCPTITANCSHGNAPLILLECAEDEDKDCQL